MVPDRPLLTDDDPTRRDRQTPSRVLLETVASLARETGEPELHGVLQRIVNAAAQLAGARYGALGVLGPGGTIDQFLTYGLDDADVRAIGHYPRGRGLLGLLIEHPQPVRVADITTHPASYGFPAHHPVMHSFLGVPILSRGEVYGNLYLTDKRSAPEFTADDEDLIVALAAAAGAAIDNVFLLTETERRERGARATTEIVQAVLSGRPTRQVLQLIADRAREISGARHAAVMLPQRGYLVVEVVSGTDELGLLGAVVSESSPVAEVARTRIPLVVDALPARSAPARGDHLVDTAAAYVPLVAEGRTIGVLAVLEPRPQPRFPADTVTTLEAFAGQAAVALLLGQAAHDREQLAVHADRERIARDLHDLVIQRLYATGLGLAAVAPLTEQAEVSARLQETIEDLDVTIREIRSAIFQLQTPLEETDERPRQRVRRELAAAADTLGFEPTATFIGPVDTAMSDRVVDDLIAAVREALSNVARHAAAHRVHVTVHVSEADVTLVVVDDGVGLPPSGRRSGLRNLAARAESLGGSLVAEAITPPGRGTRLVWRVPRQSEGQPEQSEGQPEQSQGQSERSQG